MVKFRPIIADKLWTERCRTKEEIMMVLSRLGMAYATVRTAFVYEAKIMLMCSRMTLNIPKSLTKETSPFVFSADLRSRLKHQIAVQLYESGIRPTASFHITVPSTQISANDGCWYTVKGGYTVGDLDVPTEHEARDWTVTVKGFMYSDKTFSLAVPMEFRFVESIY